MGNHDLPLYVGVDVGGTNITTALVREDGDIIERNKNRTPRQGTPEDALNAIIQTIDELLEDAEVPPGELAAVGLTVPGVVNPDEGLVVVTPNMNLSGLHAVEPAEEHFGVPVVLGNDVNVGTLGESWLGAARGADSVVGMFIGTGIGGGVIQGGRLVSGARLAAGEIGHIVMEIDGPLCGCGNRGCLEALASKTAIARDIRDAAAAGRETALTQIMGGDLSRRLKSKPLKKALKKKDPLVTEVMAKASRVIGFACLTVRHLLDPEVIVIGGGVMEACADFVMPIVNEVVEGDKLPGARPGGRVVPSELEDDAGVLGAVALARDAVGRWPDAE
ncbi:MAG: ROK family protein [Candidatus Brocadiia bacterium]